MTDALSPEEKALFKKAGERRRANGERDKMIRMFAKESQVKAFNELYESWLLRWGKERALDELIRIMSIVESRLQDKERADHTKRP